MKCVPVTLFDIDESFRYNLRKNLRSVCFSLLLSIVTDRAQGCGITLEGFASFREGTNNLRRNYA